MKARLAFLTEPEPGVFVMNIQTEDGRDERRIITGSQLRGIVLAGTRIVCRETMEAA